MPEASPAYAGGQPPMVEACLTHKVKLTTPALKLAHQGPDCMIFTPSGTDNWESTNPQFIAPIATEQIGTSSQTSYEEMVYPYPEGSVTKPTAKKVGEGQQI